MKKLIMMLMLLFLTGCTAVQPVVSTIPWGDCISVVCEWICELFADETEEIKNED